MKMILRLAFVMIGISLAACGTVATPVWSEQAQATEVALLATADHLTEIAPTATATLVPTEIPTDAPTATPVPATATLEPTAEPTATDVPATATTAPVASAAGDPVKGQEHFETIRAEVNFACITCHFANTENQLIGPGLLNIGTRAETQVAGQSAYDYIHTSIVNPSAFVVPGFPDQLMPQTYGELWTEEEINDIIAYLMTLK
ncbi:MAG: c-type cytochrome [Chloroflexi bacterium]|nr:c-type cytochrome [Chloroflexota bacterium]MCC6897102.1 c-type cytochrome [Anaerolineae bacterium]